MLYVARSGPQLLILESQDRINELKEFIESYFGAIDESIDNIYRISNENSVIICLTRKHESVLSFDDFEYFLLVNDDASHILSEVINHDKSHLVDYSRLAPRIVLMKVIGEVQNVLSAVREDMGGYVESRDKIMDTHNCGTIIFFTNEILTKALSLDDFHKQALYLDIPENEVLKSLWIHGLKYLNSGMEDKNWHEMTIKIYDSYGRYDLHYRRLLHVIEKMELGLILGESWGTDAATIFYAVDVYKLRLFTLKDPKQIKRILVGLEYLEDGTRVVDYDLFHKRKKIHWDCIREPGIDKPKYKEDVARFHRNRVYRRFSQEDIVFMKEMENEIVESRHRKVMKR